MNEPNRDDSSNCPACDERQPDDCLYHDGWNDGYATACRQLSETLMPPPGATCELCSRTEDLIGVNGRRFCAEHVDVGLAEALEPLREALRASGG